MVKKHWARRLLFKIALSALVSVLLALLLEIADRLQFVDSYRTELVAYNDGAELGENSDRSILRDRGDTFSLGPDSYPMLIREAQGEYRIVDAAIGGSGIIQANAVASRRFDSYPPRVLLY